MKKKNEEINLVQEMIGTQIEVINIKKFLFKFFKDFKNIKVKEDTKNNRTFLMYNNEKVISIPTLLLENKEKK